ncbi:MAG: FecR family protein [Agriterribacter sp.]
MSTERFDYLFNLYIHQKITPEEEAELMQMLLERENENIIKNRIGYLYDEGVPQEILSESQISVILGNILNPDKKTKKISFSKATFRRMTAIAASLFFVVLAAVVWYQNKKVIRPLAVAVKEIKAPSAVKAFIMLSNGAKLPVDEIGDNAFFNSEGVQIKKHAGGAIEYTGTAGGEISHTLENPAGSKTINIILSDGSKVWLNSGSKLTYPAIFTGSKREVNIIGEALFEVKRDTKKPFIVKKGSTQVKVLGTVFNVKAYAESKAVEVTLVKGKVIVQDSETNRSTTLSAGQQAKVGNSFDVVKAPDVEAAVAWKNETFIFNNQSIEEIGHTLSRWYNVEVEFKNNHLNDLFSGIISREASLNETVEMLNTGGVQVALSNNKIIF